MGDLARLPVMPVATQSRAREEIANALREAGVTRKGVISELVRIASTGERVTIIEVAGNITERKVTRDPLIQIKALEKLEALLDRADGATCIEEASYKRVTY
jgi:hypothetical protein